MRPPRLLCAGKDSGLLKSRCAVLRYCGYDVQAATLGEAETLLHDQVYDLVIISAQLTDREEARMLSVAGKTPAYVLDGLTLAADLLDQVKQRLSGSGAVTAKLDHTYISDWHSFNSKDQRTYPRLTHRFR